MSKFDSLDHSPEKIDYTSVMHGYLHVAVDDLRREFETLVEGISSPELTFRGHHIKYPFLYYIHSQPSFREALTEEGVGMEKVGELKDVLVNISKDFAMTLIDTDRVVDYPKDILGSTKEGLSDYMRKIIQVFVSVLTLPSSTPLTLTAEIKFDEICKSCAVGEHCQTPGDMMSKTIDAIFVDQLTDEVPGEAEILSTEKLMGKKAYITESKMTLGSFRKGLIKLYPHKKHLFED